MKLILILITLTLPSCQLVYDVLSTDKARERYADQMDKYNTMIENTR